ncbi:hypothetical protein [Acinetobacter dispersus]|uniref:hypothetical protein n=1 Tax=Acinetobacter dispersus TaxID=70348 RepID=UPI0005188CB5|nr:hypothetical protein [Acinetobacter dispersus]
MIGVDTHSFGRVVNESHAIAYEVMFSFSDVIINFSKFYQEFIDNESQDEGFVEDLKGWSLILQQTGYLNLQEILIKAPKFLADLLLKVLPVEFMGYMFLEEDISSKKYILQTLSSLVVETNTILCQGVAFVNPLFKGELIKG